MSRRRFFTPPPHRGETELTGSDAEHLTRVLRVEPGQVFELSDNQHLYLAVVDTARKSLVTFRILEPIPLPPPETPITLLPALFKFDRFEWLVEKATELNVTVIQPWEATRTETGLAKASGKRRARWQKIALEASQQSRRSRLPEIEPTLCFAAALQTEAALRLFLDEDPAAPPLSQILPGSQPGNAALILGPEGGFTDSERTQARTAGWQTCSLGPTILRAETAAIAALAILRSALR